MAVLALGVVGAAIGGSIGGTVLGVSAAAIGGMIGSTIGGLIDRQLFAANQTVAQEGQRMGDTSVQVSTYGKMVPIIYGGRISGNVIWAAPIREDVVTTSQTQGGGKGGGGSVTTTTTSYHYYADLAISMGEGPISGVRRIWADSNLVWDVFEHGKDEAPGTFYLGLPDQDPDATITGHEGNGEVPAYRDQAVVVIEDFHLNDYGLRIPNFTFELIGRLSAGWGEDNAGGITLGSTGDIFMVSNLQRTVTRFEPSQFRPKAVIGRDGSNADSYIGSLKAQPWRLACEPSTGHIFVTCLADGYVQRIDPATNSVVATIAVGIYPHEIIADDYGHVWVTHPWLDQLTRITVSNNAVATYPMAGQPYAIAKHPDGKLWISCTTEIVRFNPTNQEEMARINIASGAGKYFPCGLAYNPVDQRIWFAVSGSDVVGIVNPSGYALSWRNSGTWPAYAAANASDDKGTVFVSLLYGNRVKLLRRSYRTRTVTENVHYGDGIVMPHSYEVTEENLEEFAEFKTEVWPGPMAVTADGRCFVSNMNRPFFQEIEGP